MAIHKKYIILFSLFIWSIPYNHLDKISVYTILDDILAFIFIGLIIGRSSQYKFLPDMQFNIVNPVIIFTIVIIASILVNQASDVAIIRGTLSILKPFIFIIYFSQVDDVRKEKYFHNISKIGKYAIALGFANMITIFMFRYLKGSYYQQDRAVGFMGDAHVVGEYVYLLGIYYFYKIYEHKKYVYTIGLFPVIIALQIVEAKQILIFFLIFPMIIMVLKKRVNIVGSILVGTILVSVYSYSSDRQDIITDQVTIVEKSFTSIQYLPDIIALDEMYEKARHEMPFWLLGAAPGMYGSQTAYANDSYYYRKYLKGLVDLYPWGGTLDKPFNQILLISSELGLFGILAFMVIIYRLIKASIFRLQQTKENPFLLEAYLYFGLLLHLVGRMIVQETFAMNHSLVILCILSPIILNKVREA